MTQSVYLSLVCFNEEEGIEEFFKEICSFLMDEHFKILIIDDCSRDATSAILKRLREAHSCLEVSTNPKNLGHGPSTLIGLHAAISSEAEYILTIDGDGQFFGGDIANALRFMRDSEQDILEGVRNGRTEPLFRKFVTFMTRILVLLKSGSFPADANTPFRVYRRDALAKMIPKVTIGSLIPNLEVSIWSRRMKLSIKEYPVRSRVRRGSASTGTTWQNKREFLPSSRFLMFCKKAFKTIIVI
jgi:glycosyltransferase involved in cell wall biosynthesis